MKYSSTRIMVIALILLSTVSIDVAWKHYLETSARITAKFNLQQAKTCVNDLLLNDADAPIYNIKLTNADIEKALKTCAREMKVTTTSDMFAYSLRTTDFIFDPSLDCYVEGGKKMTIDSECALHVEPKQCESAMKAMNSGYDSDVSSRTSWQFNNTSKEYLEWVILPSERVGFDGVARGGILKPNQVVLTQGVIEAELWSRYAGFRVVLYSIAFLSIIINLLIAVHENMLEDKRNECE